MTPVQVDDEDIADVGYFSNSNANRQKMLALLSEKMMKMMTPSPQSVEGLDDDDNDDAGSNITSRASRSATISRMLCDHLVTVNDDEIILLSSMKLALPELDEFVTSANHSQSSSSSSSSSSDIATTCSSHTHFSSSNRVGSATPTLPTAHKMLYQSVSSLASPILRTYHDNNNNYYNDKDYYHNTTSSHHQILHLGPERDVLFYTQALGITISRHTDGYVRVLSVTTSSSTVSSSSSISTKVEKDTIIAVHRDGEIHPGDVVCNIGGVDLHSPIDTAIWKLTIGLVKMAIRPLTFVVATEIVQSIDDERVGDDNNHEDSHYKYDNKAKSSPPHRMFAGWGRYDTNDEDYKDDHEEEDDDGYNCRSTMISAAPSSPNDDIPPPSSLCKYDEENGCHPTARATATTLVLGPTRTVYFHETCLGVKLRYNDNNDRRVYIVGVTPYRSFPNSPVTSTGDVILVGDIILEVRGGGGGGGLDNGGSKMVVWDLHEPIDDSTWSNMIEFIRLADRPLSMIVASVDVTTTFAYDDDGSHVVKTTKLEQVKEEVEEKENVSKVIEEQQ
jgi:hypothetical protein